MGLEVLKSNINPGLMQQDVDGFVEEESSKGVSVDTRRRLEAKIDELRLEREMKEFEFDD